jgi:hypothetical protein
MTYAILPLAEDSDLATHRAKIIVVKALIATPTL